MSNVTLSPKAAKAVSKYTLEVCIRAFEANHIHGEGAKTCAQAKPFNGSTNAADAAINAGREYVVFTQGGDSREHIEAALNRAKMKVSTPSRGISTEDHRFSAVNDAYCKALLLTEPNSPERIFITSNFALFSQMWEAGYQNGLAAK